MNISESQHQADKQERKRLEQLGFDFEINADSYSIWFKGEWVGGASVKLPRKKQLHWKLRKLNVLDNLRSAVAKARSSEHYRR